MILIKQCPRCGKNLGVNFYYRKNRKGLHTICMYCRDAIFYNKPPTSSD